MNVFHSLIMRDMKYYLQQPDFMTDWNVTSETLSLSVQYLLNNTYGANSPGGGNDYCGGGNFIQVAADLANFRLQTLETTEHFPYTAMFSSDTSSE